MLKFKMLLFAVVGAFAVLSTAVAAGEELREAGAVIKENGWTNFEEVLALAEAGQLKTGEFRYDWPILMAKFRTGKISARTLDPVPRARAQSADFGRIVAALVHVAAPHRAVRERPGVFRGGSLRAEKRRRRG